MLERIVEDLANRVLSMDPAADERLASLQGSTVVVTFDEAPLPSLLFEFSAGAVQVERLTPAEDSNEYDLTLSATPSAYLRAALAEGSADLTGFGIRVSGEIDVATRFVALIRQLDIDWEDELASRVGDVPARTLSRLVQHGRDWSRQARAAFTENVGEFLTEESQEVPPRSEIESFLDEVDIMRNRVDGIEVRIAAIERNRASTGTEL